MLLFNPDFNRRVGPDLTRAPAAPAWPEGLCIFDQEGGGACADGEEDAFPLCAGDLSSFAVVLYIQLSSGDACVILFSSFALRYSAGDRLHRCQ